MRELCHEYRWLTKGPPNGGPFLIPNSAQKRASDDLLPLLRQRAVETSLESQSQIYWRQLFERILPPTQTAR